MDDMTTNKQWIETQIEELTNQEPIARQTYEKIKHEYKSIKDKMILAKNELESIQVCVEYFKKELEFMDKELTHE
jgi:hypothetical protein